MLRWRSRAPSMHDGSAAIAAATARASSSSCARINESSIRLAASSARGRPRRRSGPNAGGNPVPPQPLDEMTEEVWRATVDMNLTATFLTLRCFLPGMKERRRGTIITVSSAAARRTHPRTPIAYACAKAGIELMTQDVAAQLGGFGIRANCIAPETILTERTTQRIPDEMKTKLAGEHPIPRLGTVEDVAYAAAFLASDEASWITGVVLDVAGGAVMLRWAGSLVG